ncbi:helix-turn-helix domain-containing protein [Gordonia sp. VNQ95]|jgi:AraC-like DNA-binding protein|uniref:AraC family transcriptional regulator n=1 Tax=Gordonia TaxID=2053 RepID=UPI0032B521C2
MSAGDDHPGLTADFVRSWQSRIGAFDPLGNNPTRHIYRAGRDGLANYIPALEITPIGDPDDFEEIAYWRPLSQILVFVILTTPRTTARTAATNRDFPSPYVMAGTQTLPGTGVVRQGGHTYTYDDPQGLVMVNNEDIYAHTCLDVADIVGVWIPVELLYPDRGPTVQMPIISATPLARATAQFLRTFAYDVAVRGADVDLKAEMAAVDLVRSTMLDQSCSGGDEVDRTEQVLASAREIVDRHYRDPAFSTETLANLLHLSRRHLYRYFADTDESPSDLIVERRLARARELLERTEGLGLASVAASSGFTSVATLRNRFRTTYGVTPDEYRRAKTGHSSADQTS